MITRNNYEEFFLMYVDNELSPADRQVVEKFVADNPDLTEEWTAILECRLLPDDSSVFENKESLYRQSAPGALPGESAAVPSGKEPIITEQNYESWYLSYIDGELDEEGRASVEAFAGQHPSLEKELELFRQTVSVPDPAIVFTHKESLYKSEKPRKVFFLPWMRVAAAAVILGAIGLLLFYSLQKDSREPRAASIAAQHTLPATATPRQGSTDSMAATASAGASAAAGRQLAATSGDPALSGDSALTPGKDGNPKKNSPTVTPGPADALYPSENDRGQRGQYAPRSLADRSHSDRRQDQGTGWGDNTAQHVPDAVVKNDNRQSGDRQQQDPAQADAGENTVAANTLHPVRTNPGKLADPVKKGDIAFGPVTGMDHNISFASLNNSTTDNMEDDLIAEPASSRKNKLRGLFRKVSRVLEKTTNADDSDDKHKVQIGGFQFALK